MRDTSREGLIWVDHGLGPEAQWTREPDLGAIKRVCRRRLGVPEDAPEDAIVISFHRDGAFNKLYRVDYGRRRYMLRVSLPVDPRNKTLGEATTLDLVRRKTDVPVPAVVAFDPSRSSEIGYEWLLMDRMPGVPSHYRWRKMTMAQKERLTTRVAEFQAQLLRCGHFGEGFRGIGTLAAGQARSGTHPHAGGGAPEPGPLVSSFFFSGQRYHYPISRGPFSSSHDWLKAQLNVIVREHTAALAEAKTDIDRDYAKSALRVARKLLRMLHRIFPSVVHPPERTVIWHDDFSLRNILVDNNGNITAVIGWYVHFFKKIFYRTLNKIRGEVGESRLTRGWQGVRLANAAVGGIPSARIPTRSGEGDGAGPQLLHRCRQESCPRRRHHRH